MAVKNILPSSSLTGDDIRDTINNFGGSADNYWPNYFQTNDANKWSKWKPVKFSADFTTGSESPPFWKAHDGLCGFTQGSIIFGTVDAMIAACNNGTTFVYDPPTGGSTYPLRAGDWRNHNKNAQAPFWDVYATGSFISGNTSSSIALELVDNSSDIDKNTNLVLGDILPAGTNVANWYFGVVLVQGSNQFKKSATTSIGSGASIPDAARKFTITYSELGFTPSSYKIYPCLFQRIPQSNASHGNVMPLPLQIKGGNASQGITGSVVVQQPAFTFVNNPTFYRTNRLTFKFTVAYATNLEGTNVSVTIAKVSSGGTVTNIYSGTHKATHTGSLSSSAYTMDLTIQVGASFEANYTYQVTISGGSSGISQTRTADDGGTIAPIRL